MDRRKEKRKKGGKNDVFLVENKIFLYIYRSIIYNSYNKLQLAIKLIIKEKLGIKLKEKQKISSFNVGRDFRLNKNGVMNHIEQLCTKEQIS